MLARGGVGGQFPRNIMIPEVGNVWSFVFLGPTSLSVIETCLYLSQTLFIHTGQTTGLLNFFHQHTIIFLISELLRMLMAGSVRLDTIPDNSILIKVATSSISTYWFFKGYNNTFDAFSTPHWTKDAVPKPVETKTILINTHTNSYWTICLLIKKVPWMYSQDFHGFSLHSVTFLMIHNRTKKNRPISSS